jgi:beta-fructofuranosidase
MRPIYHITPEQNWMNDPNGLIYYNGEYHIFYQYFPYGTSWGTMHWNHVTSKDLLHFTNHGLALFPSKAYDSNGCFSGTAIEKDGQMYIYYTSVHYLKPNPENIHINFDYEASQSMMVSPDGYTFDNYNAKKQIIPVADAGDYQDTRDPKVFLDENGYHMLLVSKYVDENGDEQGQVLFYDSEDAINWTFKNRWAGMKVGDMWECPDLFSVDGQWMMILSPENTQTHGYPSQCAIAPVDYESKHHTLNLTGEFRQMDDGGDMYAPASSLDKDNTRYYFGWLRMPSAIDGWRGALTYPREIKFEEGKIKTPVHENVLKLFSKPAGFDIETAMKLETIMHAGDSLQIGGYEISASQNKMTFDRSGLYPSQGERGDEVVEVQIDTANGVKVEVFIDGCIVETYLNDGERVISHIVYDLSDFMGSSMPVKIFGANE